jgi:hypothetical protein
MQGIQFLSPASLISAAKKAHPAFKFAVAVAGIVGLVVVVTRYGASPATLVFGAIIFVVVMVLFLVFSQAAVVAKSGMAAPAMVLVWSFLVLSILTASLLFTSAFFDLPLPLRSYLIETLRLPSVRSRTLIAPEAGQLNIFTNFPSVMLINRRTKYPLCEPYIRIHPYAFRFNTFYLAQEGIKAKLLDPGQDSLDDTKAYLDILQREVLEELAWRYIGGWKVTVRETTLPTDFPDLQRTLHFSAASGGAILPWTEVTAKNSENRFLRLWPDGSVIRLPPGTSALFEYDPKNCRKVVFTNSYVRVSILLYGNSKEQGLGTIGSILSLHGARPADYTTYIFTMQLEATFASGLVGSSESKACRDWVDGMFEHLQNAFNSEKRWQTTSKELMLLEKPVKCDRVIEAVWSTNGTRLLKSLPD